MDSKEIMVLRKKLLEELDNYLNSEKFEEPKVIVDVTQTVTYKTSNEDGRNQIKEILKTHRVNKGIYRLGYRIYFDESDMKIKSEDIHIVSVLVKNVKNRPKVIATFNRNIEKIIISNKVFTRFVYEDEQGIKHINPITLTMSAIMMEEVFYKALYYVEGEPKSREMDFEQIRFDQNSIDDFYSFGKTTFIKFTPAMIKKYWARNDMNLKRYTVNKYTSCNGWGIILPAWYSSLIEVSWGEVYVDEDITEDEVNNIIRGHEDSWISKEILQKYKASHNTDEEDKNNKKARMVEFLNVMQEIINNNDEEIVDYTIKKLGYNPSSLSDISNKAERMNAKRNFLASKEQHFGFDCGFLYFRFNDEELNNLSKEVSVYGLQNFYSDGTFNLSLPYENQSTTLKRYQAQIIKELIKKESLIDITFKTVLD